MNWRIYTLKGTRGDLEYQGLVYGQKTAKGALDAYTYRMIGGTYFQRKTLVAVPEKSISQKATWSELSKRYSEGKNLTLRRQKKRR